jgi:hypothetical protein
VAEGRIDRAPKNHGWRGGIRNVQATAPFPAFSGAFADKLMEKPSGIESKGHLY